MVFHISYCGTNNLRQNRRKKWTKFPNVANHMKRKAEILLFPLIYAHLYLFLHSNFFPLASFSLYHNAHHISFARLALLHCRVLA